MNSNKNGKLILYTGCSGVGKGTLINELLKRDNSIKVSVSNTTRSPRQGEIDGVHYNFVSKEQFDELKNNDGYLEYASYCGNCYGTPKEPVQKMLEDGYNVFLEIEVQGGLQIMAKYPNVLSIFILPPSIESLNRRLHRRGTEDEETIQKRLNEAENEIKQAEKYKYHIVNDDIEKAVEEILNILHKEENID